MKRILFIIIVLLISSCGEYIPHTVIEIETKDGKTFKLSCPLIDRSRSIFSYTYNGACIFVK